MAKLPTIPQPTQDVQSLYQSVLALKEAVEMLTGQRKGADAPSCRLFKGVIEPGKPGSGVLVTSLQDGDFWFNSSATQKLRAWDDRTKFWTVVA